MSEEEVRRAGLLGRVAAGELSQVEAAERLGLSYRQVKRLYGRYRMNRGSLGVRELNQRLQRLLNPPKPEEPVVEKYGWRSRSGTR